MLTWLSMPNISSIEKKRMAQRGEMGSWVTASGYARNASPGPVGGSAKGERNKRYRAPTAHPAHTHFLGFNSFHLWSECSQSLFLHEETMCVAGEATGLGPEARGPVR